jgi:hypothetical protein
MGNNRDIRPQSESNAELMAAIGSLVLALLLYSLLEVLKIPDKIAPMIATAAIPIVLLSVRSFFAHRSSADRPIREALAGNPAINPFFACVATGACIELFEQFLALIFAMVAAFTLAMGDGSSITVSDATAIITVVGSVSSMIFMFFLTWPIVQIASHYLRERAILWIIISLIMSRLVDLALTGITVKIFSGRPEATFLNEWSWMRAVLVHSIYGVILLIPAFAGYFTSRKTQKIFLLRRAFRKLHPDDRDAVLDLLIERRSVA